MTTIAGPRQSAAKATANGQTEASTVAKSNLSPDIVLQKFELAIALILASWPALTVAVQNQWGGPDSADKRDWMAGAISDLFAQLPESDETDVEDMLLQVMGDEFDLQLEDGSEIQIASDILRARKLTAEGNFEEVDQLYEKWNEKQKKGEKMMQVDVQEDTASVDDEDWDSEDGDDGEGGVDVQMEDAPPLAPAKPKPAPEVDEDGFTKVVGKKKR